MEIAGDPLRRDAQDGLQMLDRFFQRPAGFGVVEAADMWREIGPVITGQAQRVFEISTQACF